MLYRVDDNEFDTIDEALGYCITDNYHDNDEYFEEWLNDIYGHITIGGNNYYAYDILDKFDELSEYLEDFCRDQNENDRDEARYELERADVGDTVWCQGNRIYVIEEEEYDDEEEAELDVDDTDGDNYLEATRQFIEEQKHIQTMLAAEDKKNEDNLMKMFQVIP